MPVVDVIEWATQRPLFTITEADRAFDLTRASLREQLSRLTKRGDLYRIERGKYTVHDDPMVYATYIETPSFLSLWSGLRYYDLATQLPTHVQVLTATSRPALADIQFYSSNDLFGYGRRRYDAFEIFVADPERILIDCLSRKGVPVTNLGALLDAIDPDLVVTYADRFDRDAVRKRVGFLLEMHRGTVYKELRVDDRNYPRLDLNGPAEGALETGWGLTENVDVTAN